ncbi:hypothetical protein O181_074625 [Austropuccinia psidii MF-1]|uniref:Tf2-1-like SH3-like domain-containing protein n=1 Tax=Austropuccinia psidii MF-1 TaxID=1389203 RepID=A0A9Q3ID65_9BASI|nr:hypothetical protein [Austropuccinia psidii MF-1]
MAIVIQTYGSITSLDLAQIFISLVFTKHGLPVSIVSDRGSLFARYQEIFQLNFILKKMDRHRDFDSIHVSQDSPAGNLSKKFQSVQKVVKEEFDSAIRRFKKYADRNRAIPPDFQPGAKVWLASKNIKTTRPTKKPSKRWLGPFEVIKKIGSHAYHLKLPQKWKSVHPVFHVSLLEPVKQSAIQN